MLKSRDKGFALILTLWVLMILSVLILTYSMSVNSSIKNASYLRDKVQASAYANGALNLVAMSLIPPNDKKNEANNDDNNKNKPDKKNKSDTKSNDSGTDKTGFSDKINKKQVEWFFEKIGVWYINSDDWTLSKDKPRDRDFSEEKILKPIIVCEVYAEDAKFPLNKLSKLEEPPPATVISPLILSSIKDYLKTIKEKKAVSDLDTNIDSDTSSDSEPRQNKTANLDKDKDIYGDFTCVEQLLEVKNIDNDIYNGKAKTTGLKNIMTVFSDGKLYVSKAKEEALALVPGITPGTAAQMASQPQRDSYVKSLDDLNSILGTHASNTSKAKKWLSLTPKYFRIIARATVNRITCTAECVVKVEKENVKFVLINRG